MPEWPKIRPSGDRAILIEFENRIDPEVNRQVRSLAVTIEGEKMGWIEEVLPAYRTLLLVYDPLRIGYRGLLDKLAVWMEKAKNIDLPPRRLFKLPTVYGGEHGPDMQRVMEMTHLPSDAVIRVFAETKFLVYFIGFICGLAYLGGLPEILRVPRLNTPRTFVPGGSVGMAGGQANAISTDQPSGFNYIGRTFVSLYDPRKFPPIPFVAGDEVQFISVSAEKALQAQGKQATDFL
jgi:KipI family sensor histidine kinase inhibitor